MRRVSFYSKLYLGNYMTAAINQAALDKNNATLAA